jgi:hypothetical protein
MKDASDKQLINMVITLITDHSMFINNWLELLFNDALGIPNEIKNRIFTIWFCGTIDTVSQEEQNYLKLLGECRERGFINTLSILHQFGNLVESIKMQLREVDEESQIGIIQFRNTIVHGSIHSVHKQTIEHRIFDITNDKTKKRKYSQKEYSEIVNKAWGNSIDEFIEPIRIKFLRPGTHYYNNLITFSKSNFVNTVSFICYNDLT